MPLRRNDLLIAQAREETGETDYGDNNGVPQSVPIQAMREAVVHCQNSIFLIHPRLFDTTTYFTPVANQIEYELPETSYLGSAIASVRYSRDGETVNYYALSLADYAYRTGGTDGEPRRFFPYGGRGFLIDPPLDSATGRIQVFHGAHLDSPDIRRGRLASAPGNDGTSYTTITLLSDANLSETAIGQDEYLCVNDRDGNVTYYDVPYDSYDTTTKVITLSAGVLMSGGTIASGDYITLGKRTTTHIKLDKICEPVIMAYMRRRFYLGKSSDDVSAENENIKIFAKEMEQSYHRAVRTAKKVPYTGKFERI